MIQYQYYHTGNGYVAAVSTDTKSSDKKNLEKLFEVARKKCGNNFFAYSPVQNDQMFLLQGSNEKDLFVHGLFGPEESLKASPSEYIGALRTTSTQNSANALLEQDTLPAISTLYNNDFSAELLIPAIAEALLVGDPNKQIVISANNYKQATGCIQLLSKLLPEAFMKKVGFCVGCATLPELPVNVVGDMGEDLSFSFKILFPESKKLSVESDSLAYYVFDLPSNTHSWDKNLGSVGMLLEKTDLHSESAVSNFLKTIQPAFDEKGSVNKLLLEELASLSLFSLFPTIETAHKIIATAIVGGTSQINATSAAINLLSSTVPEDINAETIENMSKLYLNDRELADLVVDSLFNLLTYKINLIAENGKSVLTDAICSDFSGERFKSLLSSVLQNCQDPLSMAFDILSLIVERAFSEGNGAVYSLTHILPHAINFFDFNNFSQSASIDDWTEKGEPIFSKIASHSNPEIKALLASILVASTCLKESAWKDIRFAGLKQLLLKSNLKKEEQFDLVLSVWKKLTEIADYIPELLELDHLDFVLNCESGKKWVDALLKSYTPMDLLIAEQKTRTDFGLRPYESMLTTLQELLLNPSFVKDCIRGEELEKKYALFFNALPSEVKSLHKSIHKYINQLESEKRVNDELQEFRFDFANGCYQTMSEKNKAIVSGDPNLLNLDNSNLSDSVRKTFNLYSSSNTKNSAYGNQRFLRHLITFLNGLALMLLAAILSEAGTHLIGARNLYSFVHRLFILPGLSAIGTGFFYAFNLETNSIIKRTVITAVESIILVIVILLGFRLMLL